MNTSLVVSLWTDNAHNYVLRRIKSVSYLSFRVIALDSLFVSDPIQVMWFSEPKELKVMDFIWECNSIWFQTPHWWHHPNYVVHWRFFLSHNLHVFRSDKEKWSCSNRQVFSVVFSGCKWIGACHLYMDGDATKQHAVDFGILQWTFRGCECFIDKGNSHRWKESGNITAPKSAILAIDECNFCAVLLTLNPHKFALNRSPSIRLSVFQSHSTWFLSSSLTQINHRIYWAMGIPNQGFHVVMWQNQFRNNPLVTLTQLCASF